MKISKKFLSVILCLAILSSLVIVASTTSFAANNSDIQPTAESASDFSWDNASVYFLLTDRFENGNTSNDHSYNRLVKQNGEIVKPNELNSTVATFHGGDFAGITKKINEGYFDNLGINAIWMSAPYEQIHGYVIVNEGKSNSIKHYAYHGYYAMDYTQTDANFGTAQEFKTLVDTAHQHGIRIVLDVVMNHPGYNTLYDMKEMGFGALKYNATWDQAMGYYYDWKNNAYYHSTIDYNGSGAYNKGWNNWWDNKWLRCGIDGYPGFGGDDKTKTAGGDLPDFRTESSDIVSVPTFLKNKWQREGRLQSETTKENAYFQSTGKQKTVRNYLVYWLSRWVEEYGVDGFRCDTAKHVEFQSWKALKDQCNTSLKKWRQNHQSDPASKWDENFWMTAEDYGSGVNFDGYYTEGGFDSKINFSFTGGGGVPGTGSIDNIYSDYANRINSNDKFNVLTYISSHDTALCRTDSYYQGSAFQLLPGAIQIFYGDESNRPVLSSTVGNEGDHLVRSDMNWATTDRGILAHWQKVGQFRKNHIAIGAGSHKKVESTSGLAFERVYNKNGISDTVFACIGANYNQNVKIKVGGRFTDGTVLKNTYDGSTATVSGGYVTFNSGEKGTILIEKTSEVGPTTKPTEKPTTEPTSSTQTPTTKPTEKPTTLPGQLILGDADLDQDVSVIDAVMIQKHLASLVTLNSIEQYCGDVDAEGLSIIDATYIQRYCASLKTPYNIGQPIPNPTPTDEPTVQPTDTPDPNMKTVYVDMGSQCDAYAHYWNGDGATTDWPGTQMTHVKDNIYSITIENKYTSIIFSNNGANQTGNLDIPGDGYIYYKNESQWRKYGEQPGPTEPLEGTTVYVDMGYECEAYAYYWTGTQSGPISWPGVQMEQVSGSIYKVVVPTSYQNIIFSNKGNDQTADLTIQGNSMIYIKNTKTWENYN